MKSVSLRGKFYKLNGVRCESREELLKSVNKKCPEVTMIQLSAHIGGIDIPELSNLNIQPRLSDVIPSYTKDPREFQENARKSRSKIIYYKGTKLYGYKELYTAVTTEYTELANSSPESFKSLSNPKRGCKRISDYHPELLPVFISPLDDPLPYIKEHDIVIINNNRKK